MFPRNIWGTATDLDDFATACKRSALLSTNVCYAPLTVDDMLVDALTLQESKAMERSLAVP
jgi:hypothetical protein